MLANEVPAEGNLGSEKAREAGENVLGGKGRANVGAWGFEDPTHSL